MRFDFEDTERVIRKKDTLVHNLRQPPEHYTFKAYIDSTEEETVLSTLTNAKAWLKVLKSTGSGELEEVWMIPILPLSFSIQLRRTGNIVITFRRIADRLNVFDYRLRLEAESIGRNPVDALRDLREKDIRLYFEAERKDSGEYEPLVWATGTGVYVRCSDEVDNPRSFAKIDEKLEERVLSKKSLYREA